MIHLGSVHESHPVKGKIIPAVNGIGLFVVRGEITVTPLVDSLAPQ